MTLDIYDRMEESFLVFAAVIMVPILVFAAAMYWGINAMQANACRDRTQLYNLEFVDYGWNTGCTIKTENGTITNLDLYLTVREGRG